MQSHTARHRRALGRALATLTTCLAVAAASLGALGATAPALAATTAGGSLTLTPTTPPTTTRVDGSDRYATADKLAQKAYSTGAGVVFVASGANFPDALAAGPAAAKLGGPLLLTDPTSVPSTVSAELAALAPTKVYLVGGTAALSSGVESAVQKAVPHATVSRLFGGDRYATGREVVSTIFGSASTAFIATGTGFADALSAAAAAGSAGEPVLLVNGSAASLDAATVGELKKLGVTHVDIAGGPAAVSSGIQSQLGALLGGSSHVVRYGGADRYGTSAAIGGTFFTGATSAYFASGATFPDALAASAIAGAQHAPLFTVQPGCVPNQTGSVVTGLGVSSITLVGGPQALSARVASLTPCQAPFTSAPTPTIVGKAEVGQALTVNPGSWSPVPAHLAFQWLKAASGSTSYAKISGATGASYTVPNGDAGDTFKVTVTASKSGYLTTAKTSAATAAASPGAELSIVAGIGDQAIPGPALASPIAPAGVAVDQSGDLYIADLNNQVEKVTPAATPGAPAVLSIVAGSGATGDPVAGPATASPLEGVSGIAVDSAGNLYLADVDYVEKVTPAGVLSIVAGNGGSASAPVAGPALKTSLAPIAVAVDSAGSLYIADSNGYIEKVVGGTLSIIAGTGASTAPTPGPAMHSAVGQPVGIAADAAGNVYVADGGYGTAGLIEEISAAGTLSVIAGGGSIAPTAGPATASSLSPGGVAVDGAGNVYIADDNGYVEEVTPAGTLSVVAGDGSTSTSTVAGPALSTSVAPSAVAVDSAGNVYIGDGAGYIDEVSSGTLSIVAGIGYNPIPGPATSSPVESNGVAVDSSGNLYLADAAGYVEKVTPSGTLSVIAGTAQVAGGASRPVAGPATDSVLMPVGVALDASGNVYIADLDGYVEKVDQSGTLSIVAGDGEQGVHPTAGSATASAVTPAAIAIDQSGNLYIADEAGYVEKVTPAGVLSIVAGDGQQGSPTPGVATKTELGGIGGLAVDAAGDLYLADFENGEVDKVTAAGTLSIVAGGGEADPTSGRATNAFISVVSVAVDGSGNLYVSDDNGYVEKVTPSGTISVVAGNGSSDSPTPGLARQSGISPGAIAVDSSGTLYVADWSGYVDKITQ